MCACTVASPSLPSFIGRRQLLASALDSRVFVSSSSDVLLTRESVSDQKCGHSVVPVCGSAVLCLPVASKSAPARLTVDVGQKSPWYVGKPTCVALLESL